jgi:hypothetical protein
MRVSERVFASFIALVLALPVFAQQAGTAAVLWRDRGDTASLNLLDGPGGKTRAPGTNFKFIAESMTGTAAKFDVEDENGARWKVKLGPEAKGETLQRASCGSGLLRRRKLPAPVQCRNETALAEQYVSAGGVREARLGAPAKGAITQDGAGTRPAWRNRRVQRPPGDVALITIGTEAKSAIMTEATAGGTVSRFDSLGRTSSTFSNKA